MNAEIDAKAVRSFNLTGSFIYHFDYYNTVNIALQFNRIKYYFPSFVNQTLT